MVPYHCISKGIADCIVYSVCLMMYGACMLFVWCLCMYGVYMYRSLTFVIYFKDTDECIIDPYDSGDKDTDYINYSYTMLQSLSPAVCV